MFCAADKFRMGGWSVRKGSITVETKINDKAIQGMEVRLCQIGTRQDGEFVLDEAYKTDDTKNFDTGV